MLKVLLQLLTASALLALGACGATTERECSANADCASGVCDPSGVCVAAGDHDVLGDDLPSDLDTGADEDATSDEDAPGDGDVGARDEDAPADQDVVPGDDDACQPNYDGTLERREIFFTPGLTATFAIARDVTFDTEGVVGSGGKRSWDFRPALDGDVEVERGFIGLDDVWFHDPDDESARYAGATHAIETFGDDDFLGVYQATAEALLMRGVASVDGGLYSTELSYDPPLTTLSFPFQVDDSWESTGEVSGWLAGGYSLWWEDATLEVTVDAQGTAVTSFANFPVFRVRTVLTREGSFGTTVRRTYAWVSECFGTIAWVMSQDDETSVEFSDAAEVGRIVP